MLKFLIIFFIVLHFFIVSAEKSCKITGDVPNPSPKPDPRSPDKFYVTFSTNVENSEPIVLEVTRAWAPLGVDRFYSLVKDGFYNQAAFFRVVPDFVLQFGISAEPDETAKWNTVIPDDPVLKTNAKWTVTYATAGGRTI